MRRLSRDASSAVVRPAQAKKCSVPAHVAVSLHKSIGPASLLKSTVFLQKSTGSTTPFKFKGFEPLYKSTQTLQRHRWMIHKSAVGADKVRI